MPLDIRTFQQQNTVHLRAPIRTSTSVVAPYPGHEAQPVDYIDFNNNGNFDISSVRNSSRELASEPVLTTKLDTLKNFAGSDETPILTGTDLSELSTRDVRNHWAFENGAKGSYLEFDGNSSLNNLVTQVPPVVNRQIAIDLQNREFLIYSPNA